MGSASLFLSFRIIPSSPQKVILYLIYLILFLLLNITNIFSFYSNIVVCKMDACFTRNRNKNLMMNLMIFTCSKTNNFSTVVNLTLVIGQKKSP